jgi:hypothetical protein
MKHLKLYKIFENNDNLLQIVQDCFAEFVDNNLVDIYYDEYENLVKLELPIQDPPTGRVSLDSISKSYQVAHDIIEDVKVSLLRLKEEYPGLSEDVQFDIDGENHCIFISFHKEAAQIGEFYRKRGDRIEINKDKLKSILKLDKNVKISIWSSGDSDILRFDFPSKESFMKHMYHDYLDRRDELPSSFDNTPVEDALIVNPELMERYQRLGNNFSKLTIDGDPLVTNIQKVDGSGNMQSYYQNGVQQSRQAWYVSVKLNKKFNYEF